MYGPVLQLGDCLLETARPTYPIDSTEVGNKPKETSIWDTLDETYRILQQGTE
jgi:hypothetical protein